VHPGVAGERVGRRGKARVEVRRVARRNLAAATPEKGNEATHVSPPPGGTEDGERGERQARRGSYLLSHPLLHEHRRKAGGRAEESAEGDLVEGVHDGVKARVAWDEIVKLALPVSWVEQEP